MKRLPNYRVTTKKLSSGRTVSCFQRVTRNENQKLNIQKENLLTESIAEEDVAIKNKIDTNSNENKNANHSQLSDSGNSNVDIKICIDVSSVAFAILYSLFATQKLSSEELELALNRLKDFKTKY